MNSSLYKQLEDAENALRRIDISLFNGCNKKEKPDYAELRADMFIAVLGVKGILTALRAAKRDTKELGEALDEHAYIVDKDAFVKSSDNAKKVYKAARWTQEFFEGVDEWVI